MSHLKKLSDVLNKAQKPVAREIRVLGKDSSIILNSACMVTLSISKTLRNFTIPSLVKSAVQSRWVSLSANQIGFDKTIFVMHKCPEPNKWQDYTGNENDYEVYLNPTIIGIDEETVSGFEECPSLPDIVTQVERPKSIIVEFMNAQGEYLQKEFTDFTARVVSHETDHLWGYLMTSFSVSFGRIHIKSPEKLKKLAEILEETKEAVNEKIEAYEKSIEKQPKITEKKTNVPEYFIREPIDKEFEDLYRNAIYTGYYEDLRKLDYNFIKE